MNKIKLDYSCQVYPVEAGGEDEDKAFYIISNKNELIKQLESLKLDAKENMRGKFCKEIFYKDRNALAIVIDLLKREEIE